MTDTRMIDGNASARAACRLLVTAVSALVAIGGREATEEVLLGIVDRVKAGHYPEPSQPAGSA